MALWSVAGLHENVEDKDVTCFSSWEGVEV